MIMKTGTFAVAVGDLGIELVDPVVAFLGRTINRIVTIDEDQDGDIEGMEILSFAQKVGFDGFAIFQGFRFKEFWAQVKDVDAAERGKLINRFAETFNIPNDQAEFLLEDWLRHLDATAHLVDRTRKVLGRTKAEASQTTKALPVKAK